MSQQKKDAETKYILAKELAEIISYDANKQSILEARLDKIGLSKDGDYGLKQHIDFIEAEAEVRGFAKHISVKKLKKPVFVKEINCKIPYKYKVIVSNLDIEFFFKNEPNICMHDLYTKEISSTHDDYKPSGIRYSGGLYFEFKNNTIFHVDHPIDGFECFMNVFLGHNATLSFIENHFKDINIVARVQNNAVAVLELKSNISEYPISIAKYSAKENSSVSGLWRLKKGIRGKIYAANKIENSMNKADFAENNKCPLSFNEGEVLSLMQEKVESPGKVKRNILKNIFRKKKLYKNNKIKVTPEQVEGVDDQCIIRLSNNKLDELNISGMTNFYFEGINVIKQLTPYAPNYPEVRAGEMSIESSIHWGAYQELDERECYIFFICKKIFIKLKFFLLQKKLFVCLKKKLSSFKSFLLHNKVFATLKTLYGKLVNFLAYKESLDVESFLTHKKIFATLKQKAIANKDVMQEIILQREISKCDHGIAKSEKGWGAWQDTMIFEFSKCISNYGTSWLRPLGWLTGLNLVVIGLVQLVCPEANSSLYAIFFELFNPTSYLPKLLAPETLNPVSNGWISLLFISQKVLLAFTLYEMVKIFRRFGRR